MQKKKRRASDASVGVIYARYSSKAQNDASIEQQVDACMKYAEENGITVVETYADRAMSGKNDKRPNFQRMLTDAQLGKFNYVLAWKSNRLGRNMLEAMQFDALLNGCDVRCLYVEEDFDDTAAGRLALRTMMSINQFHSENMAEDIMRGLMDNAKQGKVNGKPPYGYKRDAATGLFMLDDQTAPIVKEVFERFAVGHQFAEIARDLNERHIPSRTGNGWSKNSFQAMIRNERYAGTYIYGDYRKEDAMPAIVSKELFQMAQDRIHFKAASKGKHRNDLEYLLTGKLFCGYCGSPMNGMKAFNKANEPYYYYACHKKRAYRTCSKKNIRKELIEAMVATAVQQRLMSDDNISMMANMVIRFQDSNPELQQLGRYKERVKEINRLLENYGKAIGEGIFNETTAKIMADLESERRDIQRKLSMEDLIIRRVTAEEVADLFRSYRDGDPNDREFQKLMIDNFIQAIYLYDDKFKVVTRYFGTDSSFEVPLTLEEISEISELSDIGGIDSDTSECSTLAPDGVPLRAKANTIAFIRGMFVFVFDINEYQKTVKS